MFTDKKNTLILCTVLIRTIALFFIVLGTWLLLERLIAALGEIDYNYLAVYMKSRLAGPIAAWFIGAVTWFASKSLASFCCKGLAFESD